MRSIHNGGASASQKIFRFCYLSASISRNNSQSLWASVEAIQKLRKIFLFKCVVDTVGCLKHLTEHLIFNRFREILLFVLLGDPRVTKLLGRVPT